MLDTRHLCARSAYYNKDTEPPKAGRIAPLFTVHFRILDTEGRCPLWMILFLLLLGLSCRCLDSMLLLPDLCSRRSSLENRSYRTIRPGRPKRTNRGNNKKSEPLSDSESREELALLAAHLHYTIRRLNPTTPFHEHLMQLAEDLAFVASPKVDAQSNRFWRRSS